MNDDSNPIYYRLGLQNLSVHLTNGLPIMHVASTTINKKIHWLCRRFYTSIVGMGISWQAGFMLVVLGLMLLFYFGYRLTVMAMAMFMLLCLTAVAILPFGFKFYFLVFWKLVIWIGQFVGHKIEGKKPSFFRGFYNFY